MTRCLNCGADRESDICDVCGLGAAAAEIALRRRLLNRTAVFLLGAIAFVSLSGRYPPLDLDAILIFVGLLFFITLAIGMLVERRALHHAEVEAIKRLYYALIPVPWLLTVILIGNGLFDRAPAQDWHARVISRFSMAGPLPIRSGPFSRRRRHRDPRQGRDDRHSLGGRNFPALILWDVRRLILLDGGSTVHAHFTSLYG